MAAEYRFVDIYEPYITPSGEKVLVLERFDREFPQSAPRRLDQFFSNQAEALETKKNAIDPDHRNRLITEPWKITYYAAIVQKVIEIGLEKV